MNILTVHYNTPALVGVLIKSIRKFTDCKIYVFDNSDKEPFTKKIDNVEVIDNTKSQIFDFKNILEQFPDRKPGLFSAFGSAMHTLSVDACFDIIPDGFILMDSDILLKKDFTSMWNEEKAWVGEIKNDGPKEAYVDRLLPFLCYINVPMCKKYGVRYFNGEWMWNLTQKRPNTFYDTGAWFLKDTLDKSLPHGDVVVGDYIEHFAHGSHEWLNLDLYDWIMEHKALWQ